MSWAAEQVAVQPHRAEGTMRGRSYESASAPDEPKPLTPFIGLPRRVSAHGGTGA